MGRPLRRQTRVHCPDETMRRERLDQRLITLPERMHRVQTVMTAFFFPTMACTFWRFGFQVRLLLLLAWLTLLPVVVCFPHTAHCIPIFILDCFYDSSGL
jgi:hypothetical protein